MLRPVRAFVRSIEDNIDEGRGLWFAGDVGTGKTSLAMLVSLAAERAGRSVAIYPVTRLLAEIKDTYDSQSGGSYMRLFRRLCSVDLLQLDDLGAEKRTEWVLEQLYAIVNERWQDSARSWSPPTSPTSTSSASRWARARCRGCWRSAATRCRSWGPTCA